MLSVLVPSLILLPNVSYVYLLHFLLTLSFSMLLWMCVCVCFSFVLVFDEDDDDVFGIVWIFFGSRTNCTKYAHQVVIYIYIYLYLKTKYRAQVLAYHDSVFQFIFVSMFFYKALQYLFVRCMNINTIYVYIPD